MTTDITVYTLRITDKKDLLSAYMPFVKNGGVFLKGVTQDIGMSVALALEIPGDEKKYPVIGKVVWVHEKEGKSIGVGVQFPDTPDMTVLRGKIDIATAGLDRAKEKTFTA